MSETRSTEQEEALREIQKLGAKVKAFREQFPDSPAAGVAFQLAAFCGRMEAELLSAPAAPTRTDEAD